MEKRSRPTKGILWMGGQGYRHHPASAPVGNAVRLQIYTRTIIYLIFSYTRDQKLQPHFVCASHPITVMPPLTRAAP